eukprot:465174-Pelagomonas_calceolata.AAC.7
MSTHIGTPEAQTICRQQNHRQQQSCWQYNNAQARSTPSTLPQSAAFLLIAKNAECIDDIAA